MSGGCPGAGAIMKNETEKYLRVGEGGTEWKMKTEQVSLVAVWR